MFKHFYWFFMAKCRLVMGLMERDFKSNAAMPMRFPEENLCMYAVLMSCGRGVDGQVFVENKFKLHLYSLEPD